MLSVTEIQRELASKWPDLPVVTEPDQKNSTISFCVGPSIIALGKIATPLPWSELEGPCATSTLWPNAADELKHHKTHWVVSVSSDLNPIELSTLLTQITASVMAVCPVALGVYWGNATLVIPKGVFIDFVEALLPQELPLPLWIDSRVGWETDGFSSGFTTGMSALGHMEFEAKLVPESPTELREHFWSFAGYILENGSVIRDGDTIGMDANERIRIVYASSAFGHDRKVMRLEFAQSSKPWWKLW